MGIERRNLLDFKTALSVEEVARLNHHAGDNPEARLELLNEIKDGRASAALAGQFDAAMKEDWSEPSTPTRRYIRGKGDYSWIRKAPEWER